VEHKVRQQVLDKARSENTALIAQQRRNEISSRTAPS
jgi:hypothetical protein